MTVVGKVTHRTGIAQRRATYRHQVACFALSIHRQHAYLHPLKSAHPLIAGQSAYHHAVAAAGTAKETAVVVRQTCSVESLRIAPVTAKDRENVGAFSPRFFSPRGLCFRALQREFSIRRLAVEREVERARLHRN